MKQYKVVPGPKNISVTGNDTSAAFTTFADIINKEAVEGWTYHSMENIQITQMVGCMNNTPQITNYYMLIFEREI